MNNRKVSMIIAIMGVVLIVSVLIGFFIKNGDRNENVSPDPTDEITYESDSPVYSKNSEKSSSTTSEKDSELYESDRSTSDFDSTNKTKNRASKSSVKSSKKTNSGVTDATYIGGVLVVNKSYALPANYNPGIDSEAQRALNEMISAASNDGISLWVVSGFRSYSYQEQLYNNYVARDGKAAADRYSARPGHSEHQTGLAFDLNSLSSSFGDTAEGIWLANNCWRYGFIIRYPKGKEAITGYMYEPWHVRYLGKSTSEAVYNSGCTLEEYLGIDSTYKY